MPLVTMNSIDLFPGLAARDVDVGDGVRIHVRTGGRGSPLLLLHGHPQTHAIWHKVAPALGEHFTLVLADLRGYGDSSKPAGDPDHANYSKRTMARDMLRVMQSLGHESFDVLAHDRGARVAHRLALDHAASIRRIVLLDIAPTLAMYEQTTEAFARAYPRQRFMRCSTRPALARRRCALKSTCGGLRYVRRSASAPSHCRTDTAPCS